MSKLDHKYTFKRGLTFKNRLIMAPMTTKMSFFDGVITQDEMHYYHLRSGDIGAIITAAANVQEDGKGWEGELGVYDDKHIPGLAKLASAIKQNGTKAILQIFHGGRMSNSKILRGENPVAPSAVKAERLNAEEPRELLEEEIEIIIEDFKVAAIRALKAGFDGVELHGANTYLLQQFFSPHSNRREDRWGGSIEKRFMFIEKVVDKVTSAVDDYSKNPFIVGYRFSPEEYETPGIRFEDTLYLVDQLADKPLDYLHISLDRYNRISQSEAYQKTSMLDYVHQTINDRIPLIGVGSIETKEDAKKVLEKSEFAALGRALLAEPHWTRKVLNGREDTIRKTVAFEDREELFLTNGVWEFMENMMNDRLI